MAELTIVAAGVRALLDLAVSRGADRKDLLARSRIDPVTLENRDNRVPFSKYVALMRAGQKLCNDPALALHFGEAVDVGEISLTAMMGGFDTLTEASAHVNRYASLTVEVEGDANTPRYVMSRRDGQLWMVDTRRNPNDFPELTESSFARIFASARRTFGDTKFVKEVHFTHAEPSYRDEYDRIFRVPITFDSGENAISVDEALVANYRIPARSSLVTSVLKEHADALLEKLESSKSMRSRVENLLSQLMPSGEIGIDTIASKLGLSRQTLFRKLKSEGVTFEQVLDELRFSLADDYLNVRKRSVKETAYLLGFSDPTAFSRAFKRWTGHTPSNAPGQRPSEEARQSTLVPQSRKA